jgi:hypothetical protein
LIDIHWFVWWRPAPNLLLSEARARLSYHI